MSANGDHTFAGWARTTDGAVVEVGGRGRCQKNNDDSCIVVLDLGTMGTIAVTLTPSDFMEELSSTFSPRCERATRPLSRVQLPRSMRQPVHANLCHLEQALVLRGRDPAPVDDAAAAAAERHQTTIRYLFEPAYFRAMVERSHTRLRPEQRGMYIEPMFATTTAVASPLALLIGMSSSDEVHIKHRILVRRILLLAFGHTYNNKHV